ANSCISTATVGVIVNPLPIVTANGATVCLGASINMSAGGGVTYSWSGPNTYASNVQNPNIPNAAANMTGSYVVTVTDANGCVNANVAQVTVNPIPNVTVSSGTICAGNTTTLNALGANSYNWTPVTGLNTSTGASVIAGPALTTTYTVVGTDLNGCKDTVRTSVTVIPLPALSITPKNSTGCAPVCVSYSNTTSATGTCSWVLGDGSTSASCAPNHCFNIAGNYISVLTLVDANGCKNSDSAKITVYPMPTADFGFGPQPTTILDPVIYFNNLSAGAFITSYGWTFGEPLHGISTLSNPSHTYLDPGTYPVQLVVKSNYGCKDSVTKTVVIGEDYFLYVPNAFTPNDDGTNDYFFAKGEGIKSFKMYIFDRWGNQVFFADDISKAWDGRFMAKGSDILQEDVYIWKIELTTFRNEPKMLKGTVSLLK
ncbi:MAG TPA: PKD domain-containing protein, partial [Bacteroidia bacterium]|nr:PKD domain-containing protein [Bacteroidia bacterium]